MAYRKRPYYKKKKNVKRSAYVEKPQKELHEGGVYKQVYGNSAGLLVELVKVEGMAAHLKTATGFEFLTSRKNFEEFYDEVD